MRKMHEGQRVGVPAPGAAYARFNGTDEADTYFGTKHADRINGSGGNDTLTGGGGKDTISGGGGDDSLAGDNGDDILRGGEGNDTISSSSGADSVDGGNGVDTWLGSYVGAAALTFDEATSLLSNGTTLAGIEAISLSTGTGDDTFAVTGAYGSSTFDGGAGKDTLAVDLTRGPFATSGAGFQATFADDGSFTATLSGPGDASPRLHATAMEVLSFTGGDGNDVISLSGSFTNARLSIDAGAGDDQVANGTGTIDGGSGTDSYYKSLSSGMSYDQATQFFSDGTVIRNFEAVSLGSAKSRSLPGNTYHIVMDEGFTLDANNVNDQVNIDLSGLDHGVSFDSYYQASNFGIPGDFELYFGSVEIIKNYGFRDYLVPVNVSIVATELSDSFSTTQQMIPLLGTVDGGGGVDTLTLFLGSSAVDFRVADDGTLSGEFAKFSHFERFSITVGRGANIVTTGAGDDVISVWVASTDANAFSGGDGNDRITGAAGADSLKGADGADVLTGGDGDDSLNGGDGDDVLNGGAGIDSAGYFGATSGVRVTVSDGAQDTHGAGTDTLSSIENLFGSAFDDVLTGSFGDNQLGGSDGNDMLRGLAGNDRLTGNKGSDKLYGGTGADLFVLLKATDSGPGGHDRILDFSHAEGDRIDLSAIDPDAKQAGDQAFTFIGDQRFTGDPGAFELRAHVQADGTVLVQGDLNHDAVADFTLFVTSATPLVAADFVL